MNTKISYLYRDADNYKKVNECVIAGALTAEQICAIKDCCDRRRKHSPHPPERNSRTCRSSRLRPNSR